LHRKGDERCYLAVRRYGCYCPSTCPDKHSVTAFPC